MPEVFRTDNPLLYRQLDGIIVTEKNPPPTVVSAGTNNCVFIGQFERGPENEPYYLSSISELNTLFGSNQLYSGNKALRLKRWSNIYVTRVVATGATKASLTLDTDKLTVTAKYKGKYGNNIKITIAQGTDTGTQKLTASEGDITEIFDNIDFAGKSDDELASIFASSTLIVVTSAHATTDPTNASDQSLTGGTDGSASANDYKTAIEASNVNVSGKIFFTDDQSAGVKAALANFVKVEQNGQCILGPENLNTSVADAITDYDTNADRSGRVLYAYNPVKFNVQGVITEESPVYLMASILSNTPPHISPASASVTRYTETAIGVKYNLSRAQLIQLKNAGIMGFEDDPDLGIKPVSADTQNPEMSVLRRRMSDFYINSITRYLKHYQNEPITALNKQAIIASITSFDATLVDNGVVPSNDEVREGLAFSVVIDGVTSPAEERENLLKIRLERRLYASAKYLVLQTIISEKAVIVTEVE